MKKTLVILSAVVLTFALSGTATALIIELPLGDFSSDLFDDGDIPYEHLVGTFSYDLGGLVITSAKISGQWGNGGADSTAGNTLFLGGLEIGNTDGVSPGPVPWEFVFDDFSVFSDLKDGIEFFAVQNTRGRVRLSQITLTVNAVPEPCAMLLVGSGLLALAGLKRKMQRKSFSQQVSGENTTIKLRKAVR